METASLIDPATILSYQTARYRVDAEPPFTLSVGVASEALGALYARCDAASAAFITAFNPHGAPAPEADNARRDAQLEAVIKSRSLAYLPGAGHGIEGEWPAEASFLVLGIALEAAKKLGQQFEQNAIVWCGADATPVLVLLR
ncbi:DUF3293 domain-containing protein [Massilia glaciei]|uniref:DUF3293 domain-containing protein n=1 Tax=Massilia glaciei TaxID=1524097 RepID=A0A2U2HG32_9BURK|nr:DUF3293 domain-containing protein [Massilia glaciei]PWF43615.1 DUF3293 domain-containing protein [Massilia glaciei]